jgi:hypothetical protein
MAGGYRGGDAPIAPYPEGKTIAVIMVGGPTKGTSSCWQCEDGERRDFFPHSTCCEREAPKDCENRKYIEEIILVCHGRSGSHIVPRMPS